MGIVFSQCFSSTSRLKKLDKTAVMNNEEVVLESMLISDFNPILKSCCSLSMPGYYRKSKRNQDRVLVHYDIETKSLIFGICDGHGEQGHLVAEFIRNSFLECLLECDSFIDNPVDAIRISLKIAEDLSRLNSRESGTTVLIGMLRNNLLYTANIGDSRSFKQFLDSDSRHVICFPISSIHCPSHEEESERILNRGGYIVTYSMGDTGQAVTRVYTDATRSIGGLAMSRSIGDLNLRPYGVISDPDIYLTDLSKDVYSILFGSDGLTTCYSADQCFARLESQQTGEDGLKRLINDCFEDTYKATHKTYVDDMSGVFIELNH